MSGRTHAGAHAGDGARLTVLSVGYSLAPVNVSTAGGAEQVLALIDRALVRAGHRSIVIGCAGSRSAGELVTTPRPPRVLGEAARQRARAAIRAAMAAVLGRIAVDVVHLHGVDFTEYMPPDIHTLGQPPGPAVLVTLHLPPEHYPAAAFAPGRPRTYHCCVSASQARRCPSAPGLIGVIENGVDLDALGPGVRRGEHVVALGRICPEKGYHRALAAARLAGVRMVLAGQVFGYPEHERYFRDRIRPLLDGERRFIGPVGLGRKRRLLAGARCVLIPSDVAETSSLVAMEALACGTPVVTFGAGALAEIVEHGRTGYVVADEAGMAAAIRRAHELDPRECRRAAEERFSHERMCARYLDVYRRLSAGAA